MIDNNILNSSYKLIQSSNNSLSNNLETDSNSKTNLTLKLSVSESN